MIIIVAVRAYKISTIVDAVTHPQDNVQAVRAYKISTIVDSRAEHLHALGAVRAYKISTIVDPCSPRKWDAYKFIK